MARLDLQCIGGLLPNILDKSNEEDIERLEQLILKYKYKNYERPWLSYFTKQPDYEHLKEDLEEKLECIKESLNLELDKIIIEENRIKDPRTLVRNDKFHLIFTKIINDSHYYHYHNPVYSKLIFEDFHQINEYRFRFDYFYNYHSFSIHFDIRSPNEYIEFNENFFPYNLENGRVYFYKDI